jgi:ABC-2 type transport system permease protein
MTTLAARTAPAPTLKVTQWRVIRSEWIKFWSLRSSIVTLIAAVVVFVGIGLLAAYISTTRDIGGGPGGGPGSPIDISLAGVNFAQLVFGTLGVLFMATEYTTGMIRSSLAAVPTRLPVLWAKIAVFTGIGFTVTLVAAVIAFLGGQAIIGDGGASLGDPGVVRALVGSAVFLTGSGLLGVALGALMRSTAAAMSTFFGVMFLLQGITVLLLPQSWQDDVGPYLPSEAGAAIGAVSQNPGNLSPWAGLAVFLGYIVLVGGAAAWRLKKHDA